MADLDPEEYELHLMDLSERLRAYLGAGEGKADELLRDAEEVLSLNEKYPEVFQRHGEVEGLVAEMLAQQQQKKILGGTGGAKESPGCLLGWLSGRK